MEGKKVKVPDAPSSAVCDLCGRPMVIKVGKYGKFLACSGVPECRGTKRLVKDTGGICPKCGKGRMLERKSAKGRIYYGCERYPDCDFMTWDMPVAVKCEKCGSFLLKHHFKNGRGMLYCSNDACETRINHPINKELEKMRERAEAKKKREAEKAAEEAAESTAKENQESQENP